MGEEEELHEMSKKMSGVGGADEVKRNVFHSHKRDECLLS